MARRADRVAREGRRARTRAQRAAAVERPLEAAGARERVVDRLGRTGCLRSRRPRRAASPAPRARDRRAIVAAGHASSAPSGARARGALRVERARRGLLRRRDAHGLRRGGAGAVAAPPARVSPPPRATSVEARRRLHPRRDPTAPQLRVVARHDEREKGTIRPRAARAVALRVAVLRVRCASPRSRRRASRRPNRSARARARAHAFSRPEAELHVRAFTFHALAPSAGIGKSSATASAATKSAALSTHVCHVVGSGGSCHVLGAASSAPSRAASGARANERQHARCAPAVGGAGAAGTHERFAASRATRDASAPHDTVGSASSSPQAYRGGGARAAARARARRRGGCAPRVGRGRRVEAPRAAVRRHGAS